MTELYSAENNKLKITRTIEEVKSIEQLNEELTGCNCMKASLEGQLNLVNQKIAKLNLQISEATKLGISEKVSEISEL